jgi:glutamate synthase domain-containing protein 1
MCGIIGFLDRHGRRDHPSGGVVLAMLQALAGRGPDSAGIALLRPPRPDGAWTLRLAPLERAEPALAHLEPLGQIVEVERQGASLRLAFTPGPSVTAAMVERALGACRGGLEVLCLGQELDLVKQVGSPSQLEATYGVSAWRGPLAIGHTRMSTESRIDLSHSQPFWAHGVPDLATVHNGHITNYHQLRRRYEQRGSIFYTDNDSEVIGVYLRDRLEHGRTLPEAMTDSLADLDGSYNYLVLAPEGLGVVRDQHGFKPLMVAESESFVAVATEEIALRRALMGDYRVAEPAPGCANFYPLPALALV